MKANQNSDSFFQNDACPYFPCHKEANVEAFNCLFCYCPLYVLGRDCGGNFSYTEKGIKDCSRCLLPHGKNSGAYIKKRFPDIVERMKEIEP